VVVVIIVVVLLLLLVVVVVVVVLWLHAIDQSMVLTPPYDLSLFSPELDCQCS